MSNVKNFKYSWVWNKVRATGFLNAKKQPLRVYEDICVFYKKQPTYNPQFVVGKKHGSGGSKYNSNKRECYGNFKDDINPNYSEIYYPKNLLQFSSERGLHPTQKPIKLFEYLLKTYTNEGDTVLDNCLGSGTTVIAAINTGRNYIGIEKEEEYYNKALERIENRLKEL